VITILSELPNVQTMRLSKSHQASFKRSSQPFLLLNILS
jgi:hypothetical protein